MTPADIQALSDIGGSLTVVGVLVTTIYALLRGWVVPKSRFDDWVGLAKYERERADRLEAQLREVIKDNEQMILLLQSIQRVVERSH